jgi:hypothetical protein
LEIPVLSLLSLSLSHLQFSDADILRQKQAAAEEKKATGGASSK